MGTIRSELELADHELPRIERNSAGSMNHLTVIVITHNTAQMTVDCLSALADSGISSIVLVDNGSEDGTVNLVKEKLSSVTIIRNDENLGFAKAANQGINASATEFVCILNSDARAGSAEIERLVRYLEENSNCAMVGPLLVSEEGKPENSFDAEPDLLNQILPKSLCKLVSPARYQNKRHIPQKPVEVESLVGACMVFRKKQVVDCGGFDERYFLFVEETDLCKRLRHAGMKVVLNPDVKVVHGKGKSKSRYPIRSRVEYWNSIVAFFAKWQSWSLPLLWVGLLVKFSAQMIINLILSAATLFTVRKIRMRFALGIVLVVWLLLFCPKSFGIQGLWNTSR